MTANENLKRIYNKTYISFLAVFIIVLIICAVMALFSYFQIIIKPYYHEKFIMISGENLTNRMHSSYFSDYILNYTLFIYLNNFLFISLIFSSVCFSFFINQSDLINTDAKHNLFSQIVSRGLYIIILLTLIYFISSEFLLDKIAKKIESLKNNTLISINLLKRANEAYYKADYREALVYYQHYKIFIENDDDLDTRINDVSNKLKINIFDQKKKTAEAIDAEKNRKIVVPSNLKDQYLLGNYYYDQKDYQSAVYYYKHVVETGGSDRENAEKKISEIRKILDYQKKILPKDQVIDEYELNREIKDIYNLKKTAAAYENSKEYQKAFFVYEDILKMNPNLIDVSEQKNQVLIKLKGISAEISELNIARLYPRKYGFIFMKSKNEVVFIREIVRVEDKYYLYDIRIMNLDNNFNINYYIQAPYGETKTSRLITLYAFSAKDRNEEYFPFLYKNNEKIKYSNTMIDIPVDIGTIYNFTYNYKNTLYLPIIKLISLRKITGSKDAAASKNDSDQFTGGINNQLISVAILDKTSMLFLFFILNIIFISIAWRFKTNIVGNAPLYYILFMIVIPVFFFFLINFIQMLVTYFYSIMILFFSFFSLFIICLILNIVLLIAGIIILASTRV